MLLLLLLLLRRVLWLLGIAGRARKPVALYRREHHRRGVLAALGRRAMRGVMLHGRLAVGSHVVMRIRLMDDCRG